MLSALYSVTVNVVRYESVNANEAADRAACVCPMGGVNQRHSGALGGDFLGCALCREWGGCGVTTQPRPQSTLGIGPGNTVSKSRASCRGKNVRLRIY